MPPSDRKKLLIVAARQRSGTTALELTLSQSPLIHSFGEVFHLGRERYDPDALKVAPEANFFNFKIAAAGEASARTFNSAENLRKLFSDYIEHLEGLTEKPWMLINIEYASWLNLEPADSIPGHPPFLLDLLHGYKASILHVKRLGTFQRYLSELLARKRWQAHEDRGEEQEPAQITIDPVKAFHSMAESEYLMEQYSRYFADWRHYAELTYEELLEDGSLSRTAAQTVTRLIGEDLGDLSKVPLQKATPEPASVIENEEEVWAFFRRTQYAPEAGACLGIPDKDIPAAEEIHLTADGETVRQFAQSISIRFDSVAALARRAEQRVSDLAASSEPLHAELAASRRQIEQQQAEIAALNQRLEAYEVLEGALNTARRELEELSTYVPELLALRRTVARYRRGLTGQGRTNALSSTLRVAARQRKRMQECLRLLRGQGGVDANWYLHLYEDVKATGLEPALHYHLFGAFEERDPNPEFSTRDYVRSNPDVWESGYDPLSHYLRAKNTI